MTKVVLIHKHFRPYHLAQGKTLTAIDDLEVNFVELASAEIEHDWEPSSERLPRFMTLVDGRFEDWSPLVLTSKLRTVLPKLDPDVVVVAGYNAWPLRAAAHWARTHGRRCILILSVAGKGKKRRWIKERLKSWFVRRYFDAAFVGGSVHRSYLLKLGFRADRIWEGYEVVDNDYFQTSAEAARGGSVKYRQQLRLPERYILYVGRFHWHKNLFRLLDAYQLYQTSQPNSWGLVLVGDGPLRATLQRYADAHGLHDVIWTGRKQLKEMPVYYGLSSGLILPSVAETWGLSVNEAMACGLPVVVSNHCVGAPELVQEGRNGYVFDPYDVEGMAGQILKLSSLDESSHAAMGRASLEMIGRYTLDSWARNFLDCVSHVTQSAPRAAGTRTEAVNW